MDRRYTPFDVYLPPAAVVGALVLLEARGIVNAKVGVDVGPADCTRLPLVIVPRPRHAARGCVVVTQCIFKVLDAVCQVLLLT